MSWHVHHGDALDILRGMETHSVDAIVTDPPAGIGFMNAAWDKDKGGRDAWVAWLRDLFIEARRVVKPGAHALVWSLPKTSHWTACGVDDAGWEMRDRLSHVFGTGFPKSLDVSKALDKRRDDSADVRHVCRFLRAAMETRGVSSADLGRVFNLHSRMVDHWAARDTDSQPTLPTWEQWLQLKLLLELGAEMDAEVCRLNGRKGELGEAWKGAEVVGHGKGIDTKTARLGFAGPVYGGDSAQTTFDIKAPATALAHQWHGYGTALKPAVEDWWLARAPMSEDTVAANVAAYGCGALNVDGCRISGVPRDPGFVAPGERDDGWGMQRAGLVGSTPPVGRWPAHLVLSHKENCVPLGTAKVKSAPAWNDNRPPSSFTGAKTSEVRHADDDGTETVESWDCAEGCAVAMLDAQSGNTGAHGRSSAEYEEKRLVFGSGLVPHGAVDRSSGGASRFFFCAKPSTAERELGLDGFEFGTVDDGRETTNDTAYQRGATQRRNRHPTVKSVALMRWLVRLITPPGGLVLDLFTGSGTTGIAALCEGFRFVGIEAEADFVRLARARIGFAATNPRAFDPETVRGTKPDARQVDLFAGLK